MKEQIERKWETFLKINKEFDEIYHRIALHYNLSDSNFWVLYALYERKKPCTQKELCDYWYYTKQTMNSTVKSLEKLGYVVRGNEENGIPNKKVALTKQGEQVADKIIREVMQIEYKAYSCITEQDLDILIDLFNKQLISLKKEVNENLIGRND